MSLNDQIRVALEALEASGIPPERVVLGIVGDSDEDGFEYETHVGAARDQSLAVNLSITTRAIDREVQQQAMALVGTDQCPRCSSVRFGVVQRSAGSGRSRAHLLISAVHAHVVHSDPPRLARAPVSASQRFTHLARTGTKRRSPSSRLHNALPLAGAPLCPALDVPPGRALRSSPSPGRNDAHIALTSPVAVGRPCASAWSSLHTEVL